MKAQAYTCFYIMMQLQLARHKRKIIQPGQPSAQWTRMSMDQLVFDPCWKAKKCKYRRIHISLSPKSQTKCQNQTRNQRIDIRCFFTYFNIIFTDKILAHNILIKKIKMKKEEVNKLINTGHVKILSTTEEFEMNLIYLPILFNFN